LQAVQSSIFEFVWKNPALQVQVDPLSIRLALEEHAEQAVFISLTVHWKQVGWHDEQIKVFPPNA